MVIIRNVLNTTAYYIYLVSFQLILITKAIADNIEDQAKSEPYLILMRVLSAAGCTKSDVIQMRIYLVGIKHWDQVNDIYSDFFSDHKPARCIVPVPELHFGCLIEIEAISTITN